MGHSSAFRHGRHQDTLLEHVSHTNAVKRRRSCREQLVLWYIGVLLATSILPYCSANLTCYSWATTGAGPGCGGSSGDSVSTPMPTTMSTATTGTLACIDGPDCTGFSRAQCGTFIFNGHFNGPQNVSSLCRGLCDTCGAGDRAPAAADDEDDGGDTDVDASKAAADNADDDTAGSGATVGFVVLFVIFALTMEMLLYNLDMSSTRDESVTASFMGKDEHWKRAFQPTAPSEGSPQAQSEYEGGDPATADFRQPTDLAMGDVGRGVDNMMYAASPGTVASTTFAIDSMSPAGDLGLGSQAPPPADPCSSSPPQHATLTNDGFELEV